MRKRKLAGIALSVSAAFSVHLAYAANPVSQQQVNNLFCNSNLPIPSNLCPTSSPTARNPASQQYVCERYLAVKNNRQGSAVPKLGDCVGGGIVYYVDTAQKKGLIVALTDVSGSFSWGASGNAVDTSANLFTGETNTSNMIGQPGGSQAASAAISNNPAPGCAAPMQTCTDWYLPSQNELMAAWVVNATVINTSTCPGAVGFSFDPYWSSTETNTDDAWLVSFAGGNVDTNAKFGITRVRPVRAFTY